MPGFGKKLLEQCGTIEVKTAPLLTLVGAVMTMDGPGADFAAILDMLSPETAV